MYVIEVVRGRARETAGIRTQLATVASQIVATLPGPADFNVRTLRVYVSSQSHNLFLHGYYRKVPVSDHLAIANYH